MERRRVSPRLRRRRTHSRVAHRRTWQIASTRWFLQQRGGSPRAIWEIMPRRRAVWFPACWSATFSRQTNIP